MLGLFVTDALYRRHPDLPEGRLAKMRAAVVNMRALAEVARALGVGEHVLLGRGEEATGGREKASILADTLEALLGAAYLSHGLEAAQALVLRLVGPVLDSTVSLGAGLDWKTSLQELTSEADLGVPEYRIVEEGPDHAKLFHAAAVVDGVERGTGTGRSKKEAEQQAASTAWAALGGTAAALAPAESGPGQGDPAQGDPAQGDPAQGGPAELLPGKGPGPRESDVRAADVDARTDGSALPAGDAAAR